MSRLINRQINIKLGDVEEPAAFRWDGQWFPVDTILEVWKDTGIWWNGETEKTFYRVQSGKGSLYELYTDTGNGNWYLYRVYD